MHTDCTTLPDPEEQPTVPRWPTAGRAFDCGRSATYDMARKGTFPVAVLRVGSKYRVPTAALRRVLGLDPDTSSVA